MSKKNRYSQIIELIFFKSYKAGSTTVRFTRDDIIKSAQELEISIPKNIGDLVYSYRYRTSLPESIAAKAPKGKQWIIRPDGTARYKFVAVVQSSIEPSSKLAETKIPDSTPGVIESYALSDEQAVLAKIRYNRLIDIFTGLTCYSLQNHLRTQIGGIGQVETDELYIGIDKRGAHYILPVQAKGSRDKLGIVQIEQDVAVCAKKFPMLICKPIGAQFLADDLIALFEFENSKKGIVIVSERHYRLVPSDDITDDELKSYSQRLAG